MATSQNDPIGIQPAKLQLHPAVRGPESRIKPPAQRVQLGSTKIELLDRALRAEARVRELEAELEGLRPPF